MEAHGAWDEGSGMDFNTVTAPINDKEEVIDVFEEVAGNKEIIDVEEVKEKPDEEQ